jgi:hypothetical protein
LDAVHVAGFDSDFFIFGAMFVFYMRKKKIFKKSHQ